MNTSSKRQSCERLDSTESLFASAWDRESTTAQEGQPEQTALLQTILGAGRWKRGAATAATREDISHTIVLIKLLLLLTVLLRQKAKWERPKERRLTTLNEKGSLPPGPGQPLRNVAIIPPTVDRAEEEDDPMGTVGEAVDPTGNPIWAPIQTREQSATTAKTKITPTLSAGNCILNSIYMLPERRMSICSGWWGKM